MKTMNSPNKNKWVLKLGSCVLSTYLLAGTLPCALANEVEAGKESNITKNLMLSNIEKIPSLQEYRWSAATVNRDWQSQEIKILNNGATIRLSFDVKEGKNGELSGTFRGNFTQQDDTPRATKDLIYKSHPIQGEVIFKSEPNNQSTNASGTVSIHLVAPHEQNMEIQNIVMLLHSLKNFENVYKLTERGGVNTIVFKNSEGAVVTSLTSKFASASGEDASLSESSSMLFNKNWILSSLAGSDSKQKARFTFHPANGEKSAFVSGEIVNTMYGDLSVDPTSCVVAPDGSNISGKISMRIRAMSRRGAGPEEGEIATAMTSATDFILHLSKDVKTDREEKLELLNQGKVVVTLRNGH